jgi:hypothetical protein
MNLMEWWIRQAATAKIFLLSMSSLMDHWQGLSYTPNMQQCYAPLTDMGKVRAAAGDECLPPINAQVCHNANFDPIGERR